MNLSKDKKDLLAKRICELLKSKESADIKSEPTRNELLKSIHQKLTELKKTIK